MRCMTYLLYTFSVTGTTQRKVTEHAKATLEINSFNEEKVASTAFETNSCEFIIY